MKKILKIFLLLITAVSFVISGVIITATAFLNKYKAYKIDVSLLDIASKKDETVFYRYEFSDRQSRIGNAVLVNGESLSNGTKYKFIPYAEIPQDMINAFIAIEDKRFYKHKGVDFIRSSKAVINYLIGGNSRFGGSTITQQLVKNLTGNDEISSKRKINEIFSAINLEKDFDKSEILEAYLNIINLSDGCRGIGAAAYHFYSKTPSELTLSEIATLAAITNNPSKYNPRTNPQNAKKRRDVVLEQMNNLGYISDVEYSKALEEPIKLNLSDKEEATVNSWYTDMVIEDVTHDLSDKYGISKEYASFLLYSGGYRIYTAEDKEIQAILDDYYSNLSNFPYDINGEFPQSSMIVIDPYTGDILGVAGAIGEKKGNRIQNYATQAKRPPGSAIKPLSVYAPAFEKGIIKWSSIFDDSPIENSNGKAWPANANGKYIGPVTVKYAVENSLNTVAVKVLETLGNGNSLDFLKNSLYINSLDRENDIGSASLALGQPSVGITLRELTGGYTALSSGIMSKPRSYFKVTDSNGEIILDNTARQERVISKETAAIMTKLLECVVDDGTAKGLITLDNKISVAGKTGTTQNNFDRLFVGYTPDLLCGAWFGYEYPKSLNSFGGNYAAVFWDDVMSRIYSETDYASSSRLFSIPDGVQKLTFDASNGEIIFYSDDSLALEEGWFNVTN